MNQAAAVAGATLAAEQDVLVTAADGSTSFATAGALAVGGLIGGMAGEADVGLFTAAVSATVAASAGPKAARDVRADAVADTDVRSAAVSAAGGNVGVAGAVSVVGVGSGLDASSERSFQANGDGNPSTAGGYADDTGRATPVLDLLGRYDDSTDSTAAGKRAVTVTTDLADELGKSVPAGRASAAINGTAGGSVRASAGAGSTITSGRHVTVAGRDRVGVNQTTGTRAAGVAAFGGAVGLATAGDQVSTPAAGTIAAGGDVTLGARY